MKKVLFASTALIATTGVAAAEVSFSGYGRFGIGYIQDRSATREVVATTTTTTANGTVITATSSVNAEDTDADNVILVSRFRLNIDGTAETDGGVEFFARVRLEADENGNGEQENAGLNGALFSVIYGGLRVDAGNVGGAFDNLPNYYGFEPGLEEFVNQYSGVDYGILSYTSAGSGANAVYFNYAVGDFQVGASYDQATVTSVAGGNVTFGDADRWDIGVAYTFNNITAALAYGQTDVPGADKESLTVLTLGAEFGDFTGTLFLADDDVNDDDENGTAYGISGAYNIGAATQIQAVYGDGSASDDTQNYGIGVIYDLGGGASLRGGVGRSKTGDESGVTRADFGAQFNF